MKTISKICYLLIVVESICYAILFASLASNYEFIGLVNHTYPSKMKLIDRITVLVQKGQLDIIGLLIFVLLMLSLIARFFVNKYQFARKTLITIDIVSVAVKGGCLIIMLPLELLCILSDKTFSVEILIFVTILQILIGLLLHIIFCTSNILVKGRCLKK